jgi:uncharacterized protein
LILFTLYYYYTLVFKELISNRIIVVILLGVLTLGIGLFMVNLRIDSSLTSVLPEDDPVFQYNQQVEKQFGSTEEIIVLITLDSGEDGEQKSSSDIETSVFSPDVLVAIQDITEKVSNVPGVLSDQVLGPTLIAKTLPALNGIHFDSSLTEKEAEKVRTQIQNNPLFSGKIVNEKGDTTLITAPVSVDISYSDTELKRLVADLKEVIETLRGKYPGLTIELSGHPIIQAEIMRYMSEDLFTLFPIAILVVMLILLAALRSFKGMLVPILVTVVSIVWTFGLKGLINSPITIVETVIPVILISLGCANGIHLLTEFFHWSRRGLDSYSAAQRTMRQLTIPVILTSITTSLGFSSLVFSSGQSMKNMGLFLAFGVIMAMLFSLFFIPIILSCFKKPSPESQKQYKKSILQFRFLEHLAKKNIRFWPFAVGTALIMLTVSVLGILNTKTDTDEVRYFKESTPIRKVTEQIEENLGGISTLYLVLESEEEGRFKDPELLYAIEDVLQRVDNMDNVGYTMAFTDYIKMSYYTMKGNDPEYYVLPENKLFLKRFVSVFSSQAEEGEELAGQMLDNYVSDDFSTACLHIRLEDSNTGKMKNLIEELRPHLENTLPEDVQYRFAGDYIRLRNGEKIVESQVLSLLTTLITIVIILSIMFRSPIIGMIISIPVTISVLFNFGVMWIFGISLNPATAIIASVGLGVGVDYGIHYFHRFRSIYMKSGKFMRGIVEGVVESAKGILSNAVAVGIGFLVLLFSAYQIIMDMGWIIALSMITTAVLSLTVLPVCLVLFRPKIPKKILFLNKREQETS